jgi:phenylpropionate dioxygenase-like ring-hydroxylating dioxygenase large terminal subunit
VNTVLCSSQAVIDSWHPVARSVDVAIEPCPVTLLDRRVVLWRSAAGTVVAAPDRCPHREAPLSAGSVKGGCLSCAYHGWTFGDGGRCVEVPSANHGVPPPPRAHLNVYECDERYGLVWVCIGTPRAPIPTIAQDSDPSFRRINTPVEVWATSTTRMVDNFLDMTHFPFVHTGTFGGAQDTKVPRFELLDLDDEFHGYRYEIIADNKIGALVSGLQQSVVHRVMTTGFNLPFVVRSTIEYDTGLQHILLLLSTPIDDVTSYFTFVVWRNDDFSVSAEEIIRFDLAIGAEDKRMLEQLDGVLPLDQTTLVSVQADRCSVEWRRQLAALLND